MKVTVFQMKNILDGTNRRLDISEESINKLEDIALETIQNETQSKRNLKINRTSVGYEAISNSLLYA